MSPLFKTLTVYMHQKISATPLLCLVVNWHSNINLKYMLTVFSPFPPFCTWRPSSLRTWSPCGAAIPRGGCRAERWGRDRLAEDTEHLCHLRETWWLRPQSHPPSRHDHQCPSWGRAAEWQRTSLNRPGGCRSRHGVLWSSHRIRTWESVGVRWDQQLWTWYLLHS